MSDDGVPGTLPMGDWLFDGYPIRTDRQKHNWSKLDWSRAYIDMGPSPAGNPGPYWHVPWDCDGEELWARLYPKLVTTKWQPLVAQAIIGAKAHAKREAADRIEALERALKPFAEYMGDMDRDNLGNPLPDDAGVGWVYLTQGDFRRAKDALSSGSKT